MNDHEVRQTVRGKKKRSKIEKLFLHYLNILIDLNSVMHDVSNQQITEKEVTEKTQLIICRNFLLKRCLRCSNKDRLQDYMIVHEIQKKKDNTDLEILLLRYRQIVCNLHLIIQSYNNGDANETLVCISIREELDRFSNSKP